MDADLARKKSTLDISISVLSQSDIITTVQGASEGNRFAIVLDVAKRWLVQKQQRRYMCQAAALKPVIFSRSRSSVASLSLLLELLQTESSHGSNFDTDIYLQDSSSITVSELDENRKHWLQTRLKKKLKTTKWLFVCLHKILLNFLLSMSFGALIREHNAIRRRLHYLFQNWKPLTLIFLYEWHVTIGGNGTKKRRFSCDCRKQYNMMHIKM